MKKPYLKQPLPGIPAGAVAKYLGDKVWRFECGDVVEMYIEAKIKAHPDFFGWRDDAEPVRSCETCKNLSSVPNACQNVNHKLGAEWCVDPLFKYWTPKPATPPRPSDDKEPHEQRQCNQCARKTEEGCNPQVDCHCVDFKAIVPLPSCPRCSEAAHEGLCAWQKDMEQARIDGKLEADVKGDGHWVAWGRGADTPQGQTIFWSLWSKDLLRRRPEPAYWDEADRIAHIGCVVRDKDRPNEVNVLTLHFYCYANMDWSKKQWKWAHEAQSAWRECRKDGAA